jgi:hypothetical protein
MPDVDFCMRIKDGSFRKINSLDKAFRMASIVAFKDEMKKTVQCCLD